MNFFEFCRILEDKKIAEATWHRGEPEATQGSAEVERKLVLKDGLFVDVSSGKRFPRLDERHTSGVVGNSGDTYTMYANVVVVADYEYRNDSPDPQDGPVENFYYRNFGVEEFEIRNDEDTNKSMRLRGGDLKQLTPGVFGIDPSLESNIAERATGETVYVVGYDYRNGEISVFVS